MSYFRDPTSSVTSTLAYWNPLKQGKLRIWDRQNMKDRTRSVFIPITSATVLGGTPALAVQGSNSRYRAWGFDGAAAEEILFEIVLPFDGVYTTPQTSAVAPHLALWTVLVSANTGFGYWFVRTRVLNGLNGSGSDLNTTTGERTMEETIEYTTRNSVIRTVFDSDNIDLAGSGALESTILRLSITRDPTNVSDTVTGDIGLYAVELVYPADM